MVERRLGRGLDFFLSRGDKPERKEPGVAGEVELNSLRPNPYQPRAEFDETALEELAASIRVNGVIQPIVARRTDSGNEIIAGERRWRAAKLAGLERIPVVFRDVPDEAAALFALVENVQRTDLNPMEKAKAFRRLADAAGASIEDVARRLGMERSTVANFIRLLDLHPDVQALVSRGTLSMGHARAMLGVGLELQPDLAAACVRERLSVREVESRVQQLRKSAEPGARTTSAEGSRKKVRPAWLKEIEDTLSEVLATAVTVRYGRKRSIIAIECKGRQEFERVYEALKGLDLG